MQDPVDYGTVPAEKTEPNAGKIVQEFSIGGGTFYAKIITCVHKRRPTIAA